MKTIKVAINGGGRIGRAFFRIAHTREDVDVVAINDLGNIDNIAYLLKYDTAYGQKFQSVIVSPDKKKIIVDGKFAVLHIIEPDMPCCSAKQGCSDKGCQCPADATHVLVARQ